MRGVRGGLGCSRQRSSFVSESFYGIQPGCFAGWVEKPKKIPIAMEKITAARIAGGETRTGHPRVSSDQIRGGHAGERSAYASTEQAQHDGFHQKLLLHVCFRSACNGP